MYLAGFHPIAIALEVQRRPVKRIECVANKKRLDPLLQTARERSIPVRFRPEHELTQLAGAPDHQGIVAEVEPLPEHTIEDYVAELESRPPLLFAVDQLQDPRNLGAICRSLVAFQMPWLLVEQGRTAPLGTAASKASAGLLEYMQIVRAPKLHVALQMLRDVGWVWGLSGRGGQTLESLPAEGRHTLVLGQEERGLRPNIRALCHDLVMIPLAPQADSLNVAVAASICAWELQKKVGTSSELY